jgi:intracellular septation protein
VISGVKQPEGGLNPVVKLVLELGPLAVFFIANAQAGLFTATALFMVAAMLSLVVTYVITKRVAVIPLVTAAVVLVFGGLTLFLQDELFIKLKPTIVNVIFSSTLLGGLMFGKSLLAFVFGSIFDITDIGWRKLTLRWGLFFLFLAILNEVIWRNFSTDFWVSFKVFGVMPISFIFAMIQMPLINRYAVEPETEDPPGE